MNDLDNLLYVPFKFELEGMQVIYFIAEDYEIPEQYLIERIYFRFRWRIVGQDNWQIYNRISV